jgi:hypothetical protein
MATGRADGARVLSFACWSKVAGLYSILGVLDGQYRGQEASTDLHFSHVRRNMGFRRTLQVIVLMVAFVSIAGPAHAYLDPGTGSMLLSALIGVVAAVALALKMFWYQLAGWVRGSKRGSQSGAADNAPPADD